MARVKITETVLRDGHQSIAATRMRINQMIPVLESMDEVGYHAIECWVPLLTRACDSLMKIRGNG